MKTTIAIACLLVGSTFACAAPTEDPQGPEVATVDTSSTTTPQMIKQGGCTPDQLEAGWFEAGGDCYGPGGGSGGGGAACAKCETAFDRCDAVCERKVGAAQRTCRSSCARVLGLCYSHC